MNNDTKSRLLKQIGDVFSEIANNLKEHEKDAIVFLWKYYFQYYGEWVDSWIFENVLLIIFENHFESKKNTVWK